MTTNLFTHHYDETLSYLTELAEIHPTWPERPATLLALAQVHATLALAAATHDQVDTDDLAEWDDDEPVQGAIPGATAAWLESAIIEISRLTGTSELVVRARIMDDPQLLPPVNPDCAAGKHKACAGDAWDERNDTPMACCCICHLAGETAIPTTSTTPTSLPETS